MVNHEIKTMRFTKRDFAMMALGIVVYIVDVGADLWVASNYFHQAHYTWGTLTLITLLLSSVIVQIFSFTWFEEDNSEKLNWIFALHALQGGIFTRYWFALKYGYQAAFKLNSSGDTLIDGPTGIIHKRAIDAMADISMLRLFKAFLESTPQLLLQIYILMTSDISTFSQYASITMGFSSISCSTVDYQIALRKSLPDRNEFAGTFPKIVYLLYKLLTLTSWILSIALLTVLSTKCSIVLFAFLWVGGISWVLKQHTTFCKSKAKEIVYRIIVGIILIFTFFNIKGEKTKIPHYVYYGTRAFITIAIVCACLFWKSVFNGKIHLLAVIIVIVLMLILGIIFLIVYYTFLHPNIYCTQDVVDGTGSESEEICRIRGFLMH
ncbi:XK-related protein 9 isoform X2 [Hemicordylus capensis]|uniref:XK-related protein 9 isoform X2 n=1 Tax=Hemicordylus capensis TaxID=884348 RepID=UPI002302340E|nr:XK-related protein 9 isoform X2 [Hemicordylus capensis]